MTSSPTSLVLAAVADISCCGTFSWRIDSVLVPDDPSFPFRAIAVSALLVTPGSAGACGAPAAPAASRRGSTISRAEAAAKGISQSAIASGLSGVTLDQGVLSRDHSQRVFSQSFEEFSGRMVPPRLARGANMMKQYGSVLGAHRAKPMACPAKCWWRSGGWRPTTASTSENFRRCVRWRRWPMIAGGRSMFRAELMDALRIVERGDLAPSEMRGAWAGELGQTQFMPSSYIKYAVDFDGNGRRDLLAQRAGRAGLDGELPCRLRLAARQGMGARRRQFRGDPAMEQERGLFEDHRLFRQPACARALNVECRAD